MFVKLFLLLVASVASSNGASNNKDSVAAANSQDDVGANLVLGGLVDNLCSATNCDPRCEFPEYCFAEYNLDGTRGDCECGLELVSKSLVCFHGSNRVYTTGGPKAMKDIQLNDKVLIVDPLTGSLKYEPVITDIHRQPGVLAAFYKIGSNNRDVTLTGKHYLHIGCSIDDQILVTADQVRIGDMLPVYDNATGAVSCQAITTIDKVKNTGIYNPIVAGGNIIVNDVLASIYTDDIPPLTPRVSHLVSWPLRQVNVHFMGQMLPEGVGGRGADGMPVWAYYLNVMREGFLVSMFNQRPTPA